jgi:diketogulonate reductase-like aldo/keto reductase
MQPTFIYGTAWKEDRTAGLVELAVRSGFRAIDTANQRKHYNEAGVGEALQKLHAAKVITREELWLQTKFTYQRGQDHRLPYDPAAQLAKQVAQSLASSLEHLRTDHVDSFVLHGPSSGYAWTDDDTEVWQAMVAERNAGRTKVLGVSNVGINHLIDMERAKLELPKFVQNRCFARLAWDAQVREWCAANKVIYQGFSLLTANVEVLHHPFVHALAERLNATPAQVIFAFSRQIGMLPLTGTTSEKHMKEDLASLKLELSEKEMRAIEVTAV